jgi:hypothetical protein
MKEFWLSAVTLGFKGQKVKVNLLKLTGSRDAPPTV